MIRLGGEPAAPARRRRRLVLPPTMAALAASCRWNDPMRFYFHPIVGSLYRRRVEACLSELKGGGRILEVGFGSGVTFHTLSGMYDEIWGIDLGSDVSAIGDFFQKEGVRTCLANGSLLDLPYESAFFDAVLLISILEHLHPEELPSAFSQLVRVLKQDGQVVYGVPLERRWMRPAFRLLGYDIRQHHFSTEENIALAAASRLNLVRRHNMGLIGNWLALYQVGHYRHGHRTPEPESVSPGKPFA